MPRSTPEWVGASPDAKIPPRVRLRVYARAGGRCEVCQRKLGPGDKWQADHVIALVLGGEHSEANLRCICDWCHKVKTKQDVAEKSKTARVRQRHVLPRERSSFQSRGFPKAEPQHSATRKSNKWGLI